MQRRWPTRIQFNGPRSLGTQQRREWPIHLIFQAFEKRIAQRIGVNNVSADHTSANVIRCVEQCHATIEQLIQRAFLRCAYKRADARRPGTEVVA